mgnify:FL=1|tara:strand:- start:11386 stop:12009 length:624 start_codon:yes stop_codon:yes gene_type:complete
MNHTTTTVKLADLTLDPDNARRHPTRNMDAVKASLDRFGQRQVIVVQQEGMVVRAGNARVQAARSLGWTDMTAIVIDESDTDAMAYALADNRTSELAEWDLINLSSTLDAIVEAGVDASVLGWTADEVDMLLGVEWEPAELPDTGTLDDSVGSPGDDDQTRAPLVFTVKQWHAIEAAVDHLRSTKGCEAMTVSMAVAKIAELWMGDQ